MKVLELLEEIEEIVDTASGFPLTGKIMIDAQELLEIVREIRLELPDEIQQAQWIKNERERILAEAKKEYETVIKEAQSQADMLTENHDITQKAKMRSEQLIKVTEANAKQLKMSTFEYIDGLLSGFQDKIAQLNDLYFNEMFNNLEKTFSDVETTLAANRDEINELAYKTQLESDFPQQDDIIRQNQAFNEMLDNESAAEEDIEDEPAAEKNENEKFFSFGR